MITNTDDEFCLVSKFSFCHTTSCPTVKKDALCKTWTYFSKVDWRKACLPVCNAIALAGPLCSSRKTLSDWAKHHEILEEQLSSPVTSAKWQGTECLCIVMMIYSSISSHFEPLCQGLSKWIVSSTCKELCWTASSEWLGEKRTL